MTMTNEHRHHHPHIRYHHHYSFHNDYHDHERYNYSLLPWKLLLQWPELSPPPPRGGQLGQSDPGPNLKRGPMPQAQEGPPAQAQERVPQHTDKFIPFTFQMKIKWLNKICYFCLIDPVCLFIERCALARWASAGHTTLSEILSSGSPVKNAMKTSLSSAYRPI